MNEVFPRSRTGVPNLEGIAPRGNKRVADGNSGSPRLGHSFHLILPGTAFPRLPKSKMAEPIITGFIVSPLQLQVDQGGWAGAKAPRAGPDRGGNTN